MEPATAQQAPGLLNLRAHRSELRGSIAALEQALARPGPGRVEDWRRSVLVALEALSGDLREHIDFIEGPQGLHDEVLHAAPRLAGAVRRLVDDHLDLTRRLDELRSRVAAPPDDEDVEEVRGLGVALLGRLVRHRQAGADLVYEAYQVDIGGET